jgi:hypothetical protein
MFTTPSAEHWCGMFLPFTQFAEQHIIPDGRMEAAKSAGV